MMTMADNNEEPQMREAARLVAAAKRIVFLTGAGMSAESGISTFRSSKDSYWGGFMGTLAMAYFGTPTGWSWSPALTWKLYAKNFYSPVAQAQPNNGHRAVAELQQLKGVDNVTIVTQNVDGLHQAGGSPQHTVHEIHGTVRQHRCIKHGHPADPTAEELAGQHVPRCKEPNCNSYIRPDAVLFMENLPDNIWLRALSATRSLSQGDVFIVVGTSGVVYPAASLPELARQKGIPIIECNLEPSFVTSSKTESKDADVLLKGPSGVKLPELLRQVRVISEPPSSLL